MISAVVLTKNEEKNIIDCLKTLQWCEEIIIVDDYSTDNTFKIIQKLKVHAYRQAGKSQNYNSKIKIFRRHLNGDFAGQRNFALRQAQGEWVLFVDADERISPVLRAELTTYNLEQTTYSGFYLKRNDFFGGRWLKHGETSRVRLVRLARKGAGKWQGKVHEVWSFDCAQDKAGVFKNPILHYPHSTIGEFLKDIDFFSSLRAHELFKKGVKPRRFRIVFNPLGKFLQNYFWRLGFLDGSQGLIVALMMSFHSFLVRSKLYLLWKK